MKEQHAQSEWMGPDVLFGLMYELIQPGEILLDIGIGPGTSSILFHEAGLHVWGMDNSEEKLRACASKKITSDLKRHDLQTVPWPYATECFDHVACLGVLNHFEDLAPVFDEVGRILKTDGFWGFSIEEQRPGQRQEYGKGECVHFRHQDSYVRALLGRAGFVVTKTLLFVELRRHPEPTEAFVKVYVSQHEWLGEKELR